MSRQILTGGAPNLGGVFIGASLDTIGATALAIGTVNASVVNIGVVGRSTAILGNFTVAGLAQVTGTFSTDTIGNLNSFTPTLFAGASITGIQIGNNSTANVALMGTGSYGTGTGMLFLGNRTTAPTTNPAAGGIAYSESGTVKWRSTAGLVDTLTPLGAGTVASQRRVFDRAEGVVSTTDATVTTIITYAVPSGSSAFVQVFFSGRKTNATIGDTIAGYISYAVRNVGGTVTIVGAAPVTALAKQADASLTTASLAVVASGGSILVQVTGVVANNVDWEARLEVAQN